jgi:Domain of unknown function (DUF4276)
MNTLRCTLIADGSSDKCLIPVIKWLLCIHLPDYQIDCEWADLRRLPNKRMKDSLSRRIQTSVELYPCDILFVHRDAEKDSIGKRKQEIHEALAEINKENIRPIICVIPVRMLEAWLIFNEQAIRRAAGNPNSKKSLEFPPLNQIENQPDPKEILYKLLREASELSPRRLKKFNVYEKVHRVAELIDDFTPLKELSAFKELEQDILALVQSQNW